jgi:uncharacterized protein YjbI with pentapeptide repeats
MKPKIDPPQIPDNLPNLTEEVTSLRSKDEFHLGSISDVIIDNQDAGKVSFDKVRFRNVTVTESSLAGIELTDVIFEKCDLSNVCLTDSFFHRTEFRTCKLLGTDFTKSRFQNVRFIGCAADYAAFRFANFKQAAFEDCSLISADYFHSVFHKTSFNACHIDQANMSGAKLEGIDLSDCEFGGLIVEIEDLNGCIISPRHASSFVGLLGLIIK